MLNMPFAVAVFCAPQEEIISLCFSVRLHLASEEAALRLSIPESR